MPSNETTLKKTSSEGQKKKWKLRSRMKPAVWVDGGAHAREWIAPAVATWMIHTLVEGEKGLGEILSRFYSRILLFSKLSYQLSANQLPTHILICSSKDDRLVIKQRLNLII